MAYIPSPMENFNKSNPYVLMAKAKYDEITDDTVRYAKKLLLLNTIAIISMVILGMILIISSSQPSRGVVLAICTVMYLGLHMKFIYLETIKTYTLTHPDLVAFVKMSSLLTSEITLLNNEDLLNVLMGLQKMSGELKIEISKLSTDFVHHWLSILGLYALVYII